MFLFPIAFLISVTLLYGRGSFPSILELELCVDDPLMPHLVAFAAHPSQSLSFIHNVILKSEENTLLGLGWEIW